MPTTPTDDDTRFTPSGVRLRARVRRPGDLDWLFLPGGPGIGSESLHELVDAIDVPGTCWLVDLPGDGSNVDAPGAGDDPFAAWPQVLVEAARAVPRPVLTAHSTGGMYTLSTPGLEPLLVGLVLISTAPDARWMAVFGAVAEAHPIPEVSELSMTYANDPTDANLRTLAVATAPWNFGPDALEAGRELLARMPYNRAAVAWSEENFDFTYESTWWPATLPTMIVSGGSDRIVDQSLWDEPRFEGVNVVRRTIGGGAHFPWIERPEALREAYSAFADRLG
jgi:pimeloyl-ACP methyl ester carboxylesterase